MGMGKNINFKNAVVKLRSSLTRKYYFKEFKETMTSMHSRVP